MDEQLTWRSGFRDVLPTVFGYIGIGMAFGIIANTSHFTVLAALLMSLIVYAGSAQFVIVSMLAAHSPIGAIVVSTALINARMGLMSMTVAPLLQGENMVQNVLAGTLLTDETFALTMNKLNHTGHQLHSSWLHAANIGAYSVWAAATVLGAMVGQMIPDPDVLGLDFAVVAMFIGLLYLQIITDKSDPRRRQVGIAVFVAICMVLMMRFMPGNLAILAATVLGCLFGMGVRRFDH
ncbi:AzlC family ABC transporter permease [Schleiferilactobacillus perolens]|uniref:LIV-E family branched chain amino acid exporter n=1 Tax=Schleiferilactobacillus perolens DSM 12744 TaxID=1423792 RepID=A0A0R1N6D2_9LACO|nr:AzlC family ABC transporter permease [Schleiferilactobacillus perolens]KRL13397.1 LIV-E family branched chain amino acid exporter [Schleiferilactobacillus perolens DSM 12744]